MLLTQEVASLMVVGVTCVVGSSYVGVAMVDRTTMLD